MVRFSHALENVRKLRLRVPRYQPDMLGLKKPNSDMFGSSILQYYKDMLRLRGLQYYPDMLAFRVVQSYPEML